MKQDFNLVYIITKTDSNGNGIYVIPIAYTSFEKANQDRTFLSQSNDEFMYSVKEMSVLDTKKEMNL